MWLLRVLAVLLVITTGISALIYTVTGDRRYLQLALRILRYGLFVALGVFALMFLERVIVIPG